MIVITTPTGQIGRQVLDNLLESGEELRVIARDPQALSADARRRVEVIEGSHGDAGSRRQGIRRRGRRLLARAAGPTRSFGRSRLRRTSPGPQPRRSRGTASGASSVSRRSAGARPGPTSAGYVDRLAGHGRPDRVSSGVAYRALTNPSFMDNIARQAESIRNQGMFFSPIAGDRKLPSRRHPRHRRSGLAAAARRAAGAASTRSRCSAPRTCPSTTWPEIISEVLGKEVRFQQTTFEAYKDRFVELRHVRGDGARDDRHGLGQERGPRQRRSAHPGELDADQLPPVVRRGAEASRCSTETQHPRPDQQEGQ